MSLRLRRGTDAERQVVTFLEGELVYTTDTKKVFVGDGSTLGGVAIDSALGSISTLTDVDISGVAIGQTLQWDGSAFVPGSADKESLYGTDSTVLVDAINSSINLDGTVKGHIVPDSNIAYDLGSASARFRDLYLSGSSIDLGGTTISTAGGKVNFSTPVQAEFELNQNMDLKNYYITSTDTTPDISIRPGTNADFHVATVAGVKVFEVDLATNIYGTPTGQKSVLQLPIFETADYTNHNPNELSGQVVFDNPSKTLKMYNGTDWVTVQGTGGGGSGIVEGQTYDINISGNIVAQDSTLVYDSSTNQINATSVTANELVGDLFGSVQGSVFANDSAVMVDSVNRDINGRDITADFFVRATTVEADEIRGAVVGSVFADDSTLIVDGLNNAITADEIEATFSLTTASIIPAVASAGVAVSTDSATSRLVLEYETTSSLASSTPLGRVQFVESLNGTPTNEHTISVTKDQLIMLPSPGGTFDYDNYFKLRSNGHVQISVAGELANAAGDAKLEVGGAIKYTPMSTTDRDAMTAEAGMVVFNTTDTKLQVYTGSAWVDLH